MMKFIPISTFDSFLGYSSTKLNSETIHQFLVDLKGDRGQQFVVQKEISLKDIELFIKSLQQPINILFYQWVEDSKSLKDLLVKGALTGYSDDHGYLNHGFSDDYRTFISPFLIEPLLNHAKTYDLSVLSDVFSFVKLLDAGHRAPIEAQLIKPLFDKLKEAEKNVSTIQSEKDLIDVVRPLCEDSPISCINQLSRASYAIKMDYIDRVLEFVRHEFCTARFTNWILKQLEKLELNQAHLNAVVDLKKDLREGRLIAMKKGSVVRPKNGLIIGLIGLVAILSALLIYYKPFSSVDETPFIKNTSFKQFTPAERSKIDSLLQIMNKNPKASDPGFDSGTPIIGVETEVYYREKFRNELMERIYQDFHKDGSYRLRNGNDTCSVQIDYQQMNGVKDISHQTTGVKAMMKNESGYDAIVFVTENIKDGKLFSVYIEKGQTVAFFIEKDWIISVVPGNHYQAYTRISSAAEDERPSKDYTATFCEIDQSFISSLETNYVLRKDKNGQAKFLLVGDLGAYFYLMDIYGVLEEM